MEEPTVGIVVAHGELAEALVRAVEGISGVRDALYPISNADCTPRELRRRVREAAGGRPAVIFSDLASGSCAFASRRAAGALASASVVTGVSLPMLLDFVFHRDMEAAALAERVAGKGRSATRALEPTEPPAPGSDDDAGGDADGGAGDGCPSS